MNAKNKEDRKRSAAYQKQIYNKEWSKKGVEGSSNKKTDYESNWYKKHGDFPGMYFKDYITEFYLDRSKQPLRVFEAGCGRGDDTEKISLDRDFISFGCDIPNIGVRLVHEKIEYGLFFCADTTKLPVKNNMRDIVYTSNVIEHVESPETMLDEIIRIPKIGGIRVLRGPSYDYWKISIFPKYMYYLITGKTFDPPGVKFPILKKSIENRVEFLHEDAMLPRMLPENVIAKIPFFLYPLMFGIFDVMGKMLKMLGMHR